MLDNNDRALEIGSILRENNINTDVYLEDKKIKAKFKYANRLNVPYVAIIGEEEEKNGTVSLKNMETGEQNEISIDELITILKKINRKNIT